MLVVGHHIVFDRPMTKEISNLLHCTAVTSTSRLIKHGPWCPGSGTETLHMRFHTRFPRYYTWKSWWIQCSLSLSLYIYIHTAQLKVEIGINGSLLELTNLSSQSYHFPSKPPRKGIQFGHYGKIIPFMCVCVVLCNVYFLPIYEIYIQIPISYITFNYYLLTTVWIYWILKMGKYTFFLITYKYL